MTGGQDRWCECRWLIGRECHAGGDPHQSRQEAVRVVRPRVRPEYPVGLGDEKRREFGAAHLRHCKDFGYKQASRKFPCQRVRSSVEVDDYVSFKERAEGLVVRRIEEPERADSAAQLVHVETTEALDLAHDVADGDRAEEGTVG